MRHFMYKVWVITGVLMIAGGTLLFAPSPADMFAFLAGAGIILVNVLLLAKGISSLLGRTKKQPVFIFLLILKYAFLLTTLYIAIVIIRFNPVPFIAGITTLPLSMMIMAVFLTIRRQDNA